MKLAEDDAKLFYKLHPSLLLHANRRLKILDDITSIDNMIKLSLQDKAKIRDELWKHPEMINSFVEDNPFGFSETELEIIISWKHFISGQFFVIKHLKNHSVFLQEKPARAYGVWGITSEIPEMIGYDLPIYVRTVLIPFKDKIISDGFIAAHPIHFGSNIRLDINDSYERAKAQHGIITALPVVVEEQTVADPDAEKLKFYLKNQRNRTTYEYEISNIVSKSPRLLTIYHQEMGKVHTRHYLKEFRKIGLKPGWFAILQGLIVASGLTKQEAEKNMIKVTPVDKTHWITIFQFKG